MHHFLLIPVVSLVGGGLAGLLFRSGLLNRLPSVMDRAVQLSAAGLPAAAPATQNGNNFDEIRPLVEAHIDEFLTHRLGREMPMIGMFIGEKTIAQLKGIFMKELEMIFPAVMQQYLSGISGNENLTPAELPNLKSTTAFRNAVRNGLLILPLYGAISGLLIGILQLIILSLLA